MLRSLLRFSATATLGLGLLASPALAGNCSDGSKYVSTITSGGANFVLKATCKGSWQVSWSIVSSPPGYVQVQATEDGTSRKCEGKMTTAGAGIGDVKKHKVECSYDTKGHSVKIEFKQD